MKLLIIQNKFIGDVITSSILAENLKHMIPGVTIHFFCYQPAMGILENNPNIDRVIAYHPKEIKDLRVLFRYTQLVRAEKYDVIIDPYAKLESKIITFFSGAKIRISYFKSLTKWIYTTRVKVDQEEDKDMARAIIHRLALLKPLIKDDFNWIYRSSIYLTDEEKNEGKQLLIKEGIDVNQPIIMIGIIGSTLSKSLPFHLMKEIIDFLLKNTNAQLLFNFVPNQIDDVQSLIDLYKSNPRIFTNTPAKNIRDLAKVAANCQANIANEGGSVHVSKALNIPTYFVFSPFHSKKVWATFEDSTLFSSVHVADFYPEIIEGKSQKQLVEESEELYNLFTPSMLLQELMNWARVNNIINQSVNFSSLEEKNVNKLIVTNSKRKLSVIIPTKNEERNIEECILLVKDLADEIIVVDSYSTDRTVEIANNCGAKVIQRVFDYPASQKNWAIPQASNEWILLLDADERVTTELKAEIQTILAQKEEAHSAYWIYRINHFMGKRIRYSGWQNDKVIRFFHRDKNRYNNKCVHEEIIDTGNLGVLKNRLLHNTYMSYDEFVEKLNRYATWQANDYDGRTGKLSMYHFILKPFYRFFKQFILQQGFRDGIVGVIICYLAAYATFSRYVKLWMLRENIKK